MTDEPSCNEHEEARVGAVADVAGEACDLVFDRLPVQRRGGANLISARNHWGLSASGFRHHEVRQIDDRCAAAAVFRQGKCEHVVAGGRYPLAKLSYAARMVEPERIDRLIVVAQDDERPGLRPDEFDHRLLRGSEVLVLIDEYMIELSSLDVARLKRVDSERNNVADQHPAVVAEPPIDKSGETCVGQGDSLRAGRLCAVQEISAIVLVAWGFEVASDVVEESVFLVLEREPQSATTEGRRVVVEQPARQ